MSGAAVVLTGAGATTAVGLSAPATCAALRAGIARMIELDTHRVDGELFDKAPVAGGRVPTEWIYGWPERREWPGHDRFEAPRPPAPERRVAAGVTRLLELGLPAAREAWQEARLSVLALGDAGLYLGVDAGEECGALVEAISDRVGGRFRVCEIRAAGRAAGLMAVDAALRDLRAKRVRTALVGGVDSLLRSAVLARLDAAEMLRSASRPQGVIPGEAAAFCVLELEASAAGRGVRPRARLIASACADEPTAESDAPNCAVGLTAALHDVRGQAGALDAPPAIFCDLNGDRYRALEWTMAYIRTFGNLHGDAELRHPADCIGDCGAALGIVNLLWAAAAFEKGYTRARRALVWGASDTLPRAAVLVAPAAES